MYIFPCKWVVMKEKSIQVISENDQWAIIFNLFLGLFLEKAMAPHASTLAWEIPWTEEPGRLQSMGSLRVGHDWATSLSLFSFMHWRKWQPTPVFLPGESQGRQSLVGCRLWGRLKRLSSSRVISMILNKGFRKGVESIFSTISPFHGHVLLTF